MPTDAKPLLMCTRSIIAWQASAKSQTRRLVRPQPKEEHWKPWQDIEGYWWWSGKPDVRMGFPVGNIRQPYAVGDLVWIREGLKRGPRVQVLYGADSLPAGTAPIVPIWDWKRDNLPAMFMPRWACRYYATVVSVRPERLQEISREDVIGEGTLVGLDPVVCRRPLFPLYLAWWNDLHKKPGTRSEDNPVIWRYGLEPADGS